MAQNDNLATLLEEPTTDFRRYKPGGLDSVGQRIVGISALTNDFVVYMIKDNSYVSWQRASTLEGGDAIDAEAMIVLAEIQNSMRGTYSVSISDSFAKCLTGAYNAPDKDNPARFFKPISDFLTKYGPIDEIFGSGDGYIVFNSKKGELSFEIQVRRQGEPQLAAIAKMRELKALAQTMAAPIYAQATQMLGRALTSAFEAKTVSEAEDRFRHAQDYLERTSTGAGRTRVAAYSLIVAVALALALTRIFVEVDQVFHTYLYLVQGAFGGLSGALISVLYRINEIKIPTFVPSRYVVIQALVRGLLGLMSGAVASVLCTTNLAFGLFADNPPALFVLGIVAGFSERYVPNVLTKMASNEVKDSKSD